MSRGSLAFKQTDLVRAIKAVQLAGLMVVRTEIHADGRIILHHLPEEAPPSLEETFEEWWAKNRDA